MRVCYCKRPKHAHHGRFMRGRPCCLCLPDCLCHFVGHQAILRVAG